MAAPDKDSSLCILGVPLLRGPHRKSSKKNIDTTSQNKLNVCQQRGPLRQILESQFLFQKLQRRSRRHLKSKQKPRIREQEHF